MPKSNEDPYIIENRLDCWKGMANFLVEIRALRASRSLTVSPATGDPQRSSWDTLNPFIT